MASDLYFLIMNNTQLKVYIDNKLEELEKEKDMQEVFQYGKFSFGLNARNFSHLPAWKELLRRKNLLVRIFWTNAFLLSFIMGGLGGHIWNQPGESWLKLVGGWILLSLFLMLVYVIGTYFGTFVYFRKTEREVRKLIYQDLLYQINKQEQEKP